MRSRIWRGKEGGKREEGSEETRGEGGDEGEEKKEKKKNPEVLTGRGSSRKREKEKTYLRQNSGHLIRRRRQEWKSMQESQMTDIGVGGGQISV